MLICKIAHELISQIEHNVYKVSKNVLIHFVIGNWSCNKLIVF